MEMMGFPIIPYSSVVTMNVCSQPLTHTNPSGVLGQQFLSTDSETQWLAGSRTDVLNNVIF